MKTYTAIEIISNIDARTEFLNGLSLTERVKVSGLIEALQRVNCIRAKYFGKPGKANKIKFEELSSSTRRISSELSNYINSEKCQ